MHTCSYCGTVTATPEETFEHNKTPDHIRKVYAALGAPKEFAEATIRANRSV
jgi:hypothetical protein